MLDTQPAPAAGGGDAVVVCLLRTVLGEPEPGAMTGGGEGHVGVREFVELDQGVDERQQRPLRRRRRAVGEREVEGESRVGGKYQVRLTMTDTTNPTLIDSQNTVGNYGDANWPAAGDNVFTFSVPAAATAGRAGNLLQPQARLVGNAAAPFDNSFVVGDTLLLTP
jgi:hypothetical protein